MSGWKILLPEANIHEFWLYDLDGISGMIGYEYRNGIQINAGLHPGLKDQLDARKNDATVINKVITVGMGYHF
ncbi:MAG: hypothetical protein LBC47_10265 [Tannerella sp.]|jgi:hypothetical protein|nr:hypothetical protein [Tannerella sp.]